jgi:hypothetical protein
MMLVNTFGGLLCNRLRANTGPRRIAQLWLASRSRCT